MGSQHHSRRRVLRDAAATGTGLLAGCMGAGPGSSGTSTPGYNAGSPTTYARFPFLNESAGSQLRTLTTSYLSPRNLEPALERLRPAVATRIQDAVGWTGFEFGTVDHVVNNLVTGGFTEEQARQAVTQQYDDIRESDSGEFLIAFGGDDPVLVGSDALIRLSFVDLVVETTENLDDRDQQVALIDQHFGTWDGTAASIERDDKWTEALNTPQKDLLKTLGTPDAVAVGNVRSVLSPLSPPPVPTEPVPRLFGAGWDLGAPQTTLRVAYTYDTVDSVPAVESLDELFGNQEQQQATGLRAYDNYSIRQAGQTLRLQTTVQTDAVDFLSREGALGS